MENKEQNPDGLHRRYEIKKIKGYKPSRFGYKSEPILEDVDPNSEYFVMRLDKGGSDPIHIAACRKAVVFYANEIKDHIPQLSKDLIERYSDGVSSPLTKDIVSDVEEAFSDEEIERYAKWKAEGAVTSTFDFEEGCKAGQLYFKKWLLSKLNNGVKGSDAVEFSEWICEKGNASINYNCCQAWKSHLSENEKMTSKELYEIFKTKKG